VGGLMEEAVVPVPDLVAGGESGFVQSRVPVKLANGRAGWLYHLRIPVARTADMWFTGRRSSSSPATSRTCTPAGSE